MSEENILEHARDFYSKISKRYCTECYYERLPLNRFWREQNMPVMRDIIATASSPEALVHRAQQTFMFSVNVASPIKERAVDWLLDQRHSRCAEIFELLPEVQESSFSFPANNVERRGRKLTPDFLRTINIGFQIARYLELPAAGFDVLELGGGLGHLARTLKLLGYSHSHMIVDLPETLVFSYCFLSLNFPEARMLLVEDEASARSLSTNQYDFAFVPALLAEVASERPYDLFVNTASLGEMPNKTIRFWQDFIQNRLQVRYAYTLNRYLNTIDPNQHAWRWEENECSVHYDRRWNILQWELEPGFTRCPYIDTIIARYLEIAGERLEEIDESVCESRANEMLLSVQEQDWYSIKGESAIMMRGDHILAHDLGIGGTLFTLWNVVRLKPSAEAVAALLRYLNTLLARDDRVFEEERFYQNLFFELFDTERNRTLEEFASQLRQKVRLQGPSQRPVLVASHDNYNFVSAGERVYAISMAIGRVNLFQDRLGEQELAPILFIGETLELVREKVKAFTRKTAVPTVELMGEMKGYNIVKAEKSFVAVAKQLGPIDLFHDRLGERELLPYILIASDLDSLRDRIAKSRGLY
jgi:putative sugar O-methyltransferase